MLIGAESAGACGDPALRGDFLPKLPPRDVLAGLVTAGERGPELLIATLGERPGILGWQRRFQIWPGMTPCIQKLMVARLEDAAQAWVAPAPSSGSLCVDEPYAAG